jgi:hypothetical protein
MNNLQIGTGVRLPSDPDFATGEVEEIGTDSVSVRWQYCTASIRWDGTNRVELCDALISVKVHPGKLVVCSQLEHDYWPALWSPCVRWAFPEIYVNDECDFVARMQVYGAPKNPWKE